jgi:hypothetical protein
MDEENISIKEKLTVEVSHYLVLFEISELSYSC